MIPNARPARSREAHPVAVSHGPPHAGRGQIDGCRAWVWLTTLRGALLTFARVGPRASLWSAYDAQTFLAVDPAARVLGRGVSRQVRVDGLRRADALVAERPLQLLEPSALLDEAASVEMPERVISAAGRIEAGGVVDAIDEVPLRSVSDRPPVSATQHQPARVRVIPAAVPPVGQDERGPRELPFERDGPQRVAIELVDDADRAFLSAEPTPLQGVQLLLSTAGCGGELQHETRGWRLVATCRVDAVCGLAQFRQVFIGEDVRVGATRLGQCNL